MDTGAPRYVLPFKVCLNLSLLIDFWERQAEDTSATAWPMARAILEELEQAPELRGRIEDMSILERHRGLLERMMAAVVPVGGENDCFAAAVVPFRLHPFYQTPAAARIGLFDERRFEGRLNVDPELLRLGKAMAGYEYILRHWVGVHADFQYSMVQTIRDDDTGLERHFKFHVDSRFIRLEVAEGTLKPSRENLERLIAEPTNLELWTALLPPESFSFEGLTVLQASDVTPEEVVSRLKNDLIAKGAMASPENIDHLRDRLRNLLREPGLELGIIGFTRGDDVDAILQAHPVGRSLLLCDTTAPTCPNRQHSFYAEAFEARDPVIVYDLESDTRSAFESSLVEQGLRNLLVAPLRVGDRVTGMLELASPRPGAINAFNALQLADVLPLFATALARSLDELEDRVQAVIKQQYTAIHPAVEWRFREAALAHLQARERRDELPEPEQIVFEDVFPLYGLADIRGSSSIRSQAIRADLRDQLKLASDVVNAAGQDRPLPALEEIGYRLTQLSQQMDSDLRTEDETSVLEFLHEDVEPLFGQVRSFGPEVERAVDAYRGALDPALGLVYRRRRDFEQSVGLLNDTVGRVIAEEQVRAQEIFPHYFERFKTDGVDYSMYVGASLVEGGDFDALYLKSLRIWQITLACRVEWELARQRPSWPVPLDVTHLILVQDQPLSIRFRIDEKQFDVDGAYNIRYEIVKKRIDKARVQDSRERVTQPGKLAVVYATAREAQEYRRYLEFLASKGYFEEGIEELEIEDLQGVYGLKALRVTIAERSDDEIEASPRRPRASEVARLAAGEVAGA